MSGGGGSLPQMGRPGYYPQEIEGPIPIGPGGYYGSSGYDNMGPGDGYGGL